jgi:hypothetical protein
MRSAEPGAGVRSGLDEHLQGLAVGHGAVAVGDLVQANSAVEHPAGFDPALQHVGEQPLDVSPGRGVGWVEAAVIR